MTALVVKPFSFYSKEVGKVPGLTQQYLDVETNLEGQFFTIVHDGKNEDTGHGMSYYTRLSIYAIGEARPLYSTGYQLWRPGGMHTTDRPHLEINRPKIVQETPELITFGYVDGNNEIHVRTCDQKGYVEDIERFDMRKHKSDIANLTIPNSPAEFKDWVYRQCNSNLLHVDKLYNDERSCVVVALHCSRSVDAAHDWYQVFVWVKGNGAAVGGRIWTYARNPQSKFSTNYLSCSATVDGHVVNITGRSQYRDISFEKAFELQSEGE